MDEEMIEAFAKAIGDALPESDSFTLAPSQINRAARAAHSVMAGQIAELPDAFVLGELAFAARAMRSKKQRELAKLEAKAPEDEHLPSMRSRLARLEEGQAWLDSTRAALAQHKGTDR